MKYIILGILCITIGVLSMIVNDMDATYLVLMSIFGIGLILVQDGLMRRSLNEGSFFFSRIKQHI